MLRLVHHFPKTRMNNLAPLFWVSCDAEGYDVTPLMWKRRVTTHEEGRKFSEIFRKLSRLTCEILGRTDESACWDKTDCGRFLLSPVIRTRSWLFFPQTCHCDSSTTHLDYMSRWGVEGGCGCVKHKWKSGHMRDLYLRPHHPTQAVMFPAGTTPAIELRRS